MRLRRLLKTLRTCPLPRGRKLLGKLAEYIECGLVHGQTPEKHLRRGISRVASLSARGAKKPRVPS
ncbi:hypothetical protein MGG_17451 [Pyricularia oryzae 70-15]|uniref:Uncharacterized protein n=3 Tax=Pyricularia oryzae TaxID=318829 RepID=G4NC22_PYRO7|nr:uncharacterized protein MGG_17451 [Pyricularia oryzae 70-15]EHA49025.1 hypothetical protein MGG_17451 [Pyricularia oryzae 70-15]ELQ42570.1 hypothetical protein OOU_Y34scaffold00203g59 [Pyricularia oryzae Y34]